MMDDSHMPCQSLDEYVFKVRVWGVGVMVSLDVGQGIPWSQELPLD